jgi:chaperone BCS1
MDIALLSLASANLDDDDLQELLATPPPNAIVLIEDIDCVFVQRQGTEEKRSKLTFSGLLNAIDGVASGEGRILFATTNHIERLDPALIRPGRIDHKELVGYADREQLQRIFLRFFGEGERDNAEKFSKVLPNRTIPMSAVQTYLVQHSQSAAAACRHVSELVSEQREAVEEPAAKF